MTFNSKIAESLNMNIPEEEETATMVPIVEPHELVSVDNDKLPEMGDIDMTMAVAERQLDDVINNGMESLVEQTGETINIEPKYRNRHLEVVSMTRKDVFDAIKQKMEFQLKKRKQRMTEQQYGGQPIDGDGGGTDVTGFFSGNREELMRMYLENAKSTAKDVDTV